MSKKADQTANLLVQLQPGDKVRLSPKARRQIKKRGARGANSWKGVRRYLFPFLLDGTGIVRSVTDATICVGWGEHHFFAFDRYHHFFSFDRDHLELDC